MINNIKNLLINLKMKFNKINLLILKYRKIRLESQIKIRILRLNNYFINYNFYY